MKKLFSKAKNFCAAVAVRIQSAISNAKAAVCRTQTVLASSRAEGFVDTAGASVRA